MQAPRLSPLTQATDSQLAQHRGRAVRSAKTVFFVTLSKERKMALHVSGENDCVTPLGEWVFFSKDVAQIVGISLRQLQWWDERKVVSPRQQDHRRVYSYLQVLEIFTVAAFRRKGISLQRIRRVVRSLRRELGKRVNESLAYQPTLYVLTDGKSVHLEEQPAPILSRLSDARTGMYLVCLSDQIRAITSKKLPRRHLTKQLPLFEDRNEGTV
jgi:DNA-binding transcriptional MerR regulator